MTRIGVLQEEGPEDHAGEGREEEAGGGER